MVSLILQVQSELCHFMTHIFSWNKDPWAGLWMWWLVMCGWEWKPVNPVRKKQQRSWSHLGGCSSLSEEGGVVRRTESKVERTKQVLTNEARGGEEWSEEREINMEKEEEKSTLTPPGGPCRGRRWWVWFRQGSCYWYEPSWKSFGGSLSPRELVPRGSIMFL